MLRLEGWRHSLWINDAYTLSMLPVHWLNLLLATVQSLYIICVDMAAHRSIALGLRLCSWRFWKWQRLQTTKMGEQKVQVRGRCTLQGACWFACPPETLYWRAPVKPQTMSLLCIGRKIATGGCYLIRGRNECCVSKDGMWLAN